MNVTTTVDLIDNPTNVIDELLRLGMGDQGRLEYIKSAINKKSIIYQTDKIYLKKMKEKLQKRKENYLEQNLILENPPDKTQKHTISPLGLTNSNKSIQKNIEIYEKTISSALKEIANLRDSELKILEELHGILKTMQNTSSVNFTENKDFISHTRPIPTTSQNKLEGKRYFDSMIIASSGCLIVWYSGYIKLIEISTIQDIFLGGFIGLASASIIVRKLIKKISNRNSEKTIDAQFPSPNNNIKSSTETIININNKSQLVTLQEQISYKIDNTKTSLTQLNTSIHSVIETHPNLHDESKKVLDSFLWADKYLQDSEWAKKEGDALILQDHLEDAFYKYQFSFNMVKKSQEHIDKLKEYLKSVESLQNS